jgi:hypothetical protein
MYAPDMSMVTASSLATRVAAQLLEEGLQRGGVLAGLRPDDALRAVIDDDGDVLVVPAVRELVDADVREPVEQVGALVALDHALDDVADGGPGDAHQRADGGLVAALGEAADLVLEGAREPGADVGPRHVLDDDAAARAVDPADIVVEVPGHPGEVEVPPASASTVVATAGAAAAGAPRAAPGRRDLDLEAGVRERATARAGVFQAEQLGE